MTRLLGPDPAARSPWGPVRQFADRIVTVTTDQAGTTLADIAAFDPDNPLVPGVAISESRVRTDRESRIPQFWFPDGVTTLYGRVARLGVTVPLYVTDLSGLGSSLDTTGMFGPNGRVNNYVDATTIVSIFESGHGWTGSAGQAADTSDYITGAQSVSITTGGTGAYKLVEKTGLSYDLTGKQLRLRVKCPDITNLQGINVWAGNDSSYTNAWKWFVNGTPGGSNVVISGGTTPAKGWITLTLNLGTAQQIGTPTATSIAAMKIDVTRQSGASSEVTLKIDAWEIIPAPVLAFPSGVVSICFDDNLSGVWANAQPILAAKGYRTTQFIISDVVGVGGRLSLDQLHTLQAQGHEICSHALTDADHGLTYTGMSAAQLDADLRGQRGLLVSQGFRGQGTAYPLGQWGTTTDGTPTTEIVRRYFNYARNTAWGTNKTGETVPPGNIYSLRARSSITGYSGGISAAALLTDLANVKAQSGWAILCFHKVVTTTPTQLTEILQSDFQTVIDGIATLGMPVLPIGDVLSYVTPPAAVTFGTSPPLVSGGVGAAGSASTAARSDHAHPVNTLSASDYGFIAWNYPWWAAGTAFLLATAGLVYICKIAIPTATTITNLHLHVSTAGSGLTTGQNWAGLYNSSKTLLSATGDQTTPWSSTGAKTMALTTPQAVQAGTHYIAIVANGTTLPTVYRNASSAAVNGINNAANSNWATADTGVTTALPNTLGAFTAFSTTIAVAVS